MRQGSKKRGKNFLRRIVVAIMFFVLAGIHFVLFGQWITFVFAIGATVLTWFLEAWLYPKRGVILFAFGGMILGYFVANLVWNVVNQMALLRLPQAYQFYFLAAMMYVGFYLPYSAKRLAFGGIGLEEEKSSVELKILDTSVIIDGRIADVADTGFLSGVVIIPKFVLNEIQALADSRDPIKRSRARRGLDILNKLKENSLIELRIVSRDFPDIRGVDMKLIALAKELHANIVTNDYNLNKIAKLDDIRILNINDLANALKMVFLPGEELELDVLKEGKEPNQGVGYLPDGTMVVVANGQSYIGRKVVVKVTSVLQTSAGRIVFTEVKK
ncbi:PIN/TRAM domain-containing protein [Thermospira aquatica]|uniref:TRAM domain-containing protein n=1 Tax=Thermospira aquatica TaxID=2828656 RepID=A0AAX3BA41_9SPIR|nr:TRAM domain-containing protein [Thermospira aquatica]URA09118.1 TRAM domain-containing protein [Thermospira aquatica]